MRRLWWCGETIGEWVWGGRGEGEGEMEGDEERSVGVEVDDMAISGGVFCVDRYLTELFLLGC